MLCVCVSRGLLNSAPGYVLWQHSEGCNCGGDKLNATWQKCEALYSILNTLPAKQTLHASHAFCWWIPLVFPFLWSNAIMMTLQNPLRLKELLFLHNESLCATILQIGKLVFIVFSVYIMYGALLLLPSLIETFWREMTDLYSKICLT